MSKSDPYVKFEELPKLVPALSVLTYSVPHGIYEEKGQSQSLEIHYYHNLPLEVIFD